MTNALLHRRFQSDGGSAPRRSLASLPTQSRSSGPSLGVGHPKRRLERGAERQGGAVVRSAPSIGDPAKDMASGWEARTTQTILRQAVDKEGMIRVRPEATGPATGPAVPARGAARLRAASWPLGADQRPLLAPHFGRRLDRIWIFNDIPATAPTDRGNAQAFAVDKEIAHIRQQDESVPFGDA